MTGSSRYSKVPPAGDRKPPMSKSNVLFPQPYGPNRATTSPSVTFNDTSAKTIFCASYPADTFSNVSIVFIFRLARVGRSRGAISLTPVARTHQRQSSKHPVRACDQSFGLPDTRDARARFDMPIPVALLSFQRR